MHGQSNDRVTLPDDPNTKTVLKIRFREVILEYLAHFALSRGTRRASNADSTRVAVDL